MPSRSFCSALVLRCDSCQCPIKAERGTLIHTSSGAVRRLAGPVSRSSSSSDGGSLGPLYRHEHQVMGSGGGDDASCAFGDAPSPPSRRVPVELLHGADAPSPPSPGDRVDHPHGPLDAPGAAPSLHVEDPHAPNVPFPLLPPWLGAAGASELA